MQGKLTMSAFRAAMRLGKQEVAMQRLKPAPRRTAP